MKWSYEVSPQHIEGEVEADDYDAASQATTQDELDKAADAILAGTWTMRQVTEDDAQEVGGEE